MPRVLLLLPTSTYRTEDFVAAAMRLGVDVTIASEEPSTLERLNPAGLLTLDFSDPAKSARQAIDFAARHPVDAVVAADGPAVVIGATICQSLGLPTNSAEAAEAAQDKFRMHQQFERSDIPSPRFSLVSFDDDLHRIAQQIDYPSVIKPLTLSASQGVMRVDDEAGFVRSVDRLRRIMAAAQPRDPNRDASDQSAQHFLVEGFVSGPEFALEGLLTGGKLRVLAIFDKPDPLDGPYFEETIYVTPSRLPDEKQRALADCAERAAAALGLTHGPVHAELRWSETGPCVLEVNPRSIGGLCSRTLRFGTGMSLEELIIRHAIDPGFEIPQREAHAAGVMMLPTQRAGILRGIHGMDEAKQVEHIVGVTMTARVGQQLVPLPEGARYLGFIFARAETPAIVESSLREAFRRLQFDVESETA